MNRMIVVPLFFSTVVLAQPQESVPLPPPDLPESRSLQDEINQQRGRSVSPGKGTIDYTLGSQGARGRLEPRQDDLDPDMQVPQWELFRWKSSTGGR